MTTSLPNKWRKQRRNKWKVEKYHGRSLRDVPIEPRRKRTKELTEFMIATGGWSHDSEERRWKGSRRRKRWLPIKEG